MYFTKLQNTITALGDKRFIEKEKYKIFYNVKGKVNSIKKNPCAFSFSFENHFRLIIIACRGLSPFNGLF